MDTTRRRRRAVAVIKLGVTSGLIYWLLANADFAALGAMLNRVGKALFIAALTASLSGYVVTAWRWWLLLKHVRSDVSFNRVLPSYFLGLFFNNFLPGGIGGDVARALHLSRRGLSLRALAASMILDRGIALIALLISASAVALFLPQIGLNPGTRSAIVILLLGSAAGAALAFSPWVGALLKWLQRRYQHARILRGILESASLCYSYRKHPGLLVAAVLLSVLGQSIAILAYVLLAHGIGLTLSPATYFVIIPLVFLAAMLPISLGGLGVREGALVGLLIAFGADRQLAIGLSLIYLFLLWLSTLPGAVVWLSRAPVR